jgi:hypothetical protein
MLAPDGLMVYRDQLCQASWYEEINGAALAADHSQYSSTVSSLGAPCALLIAANHVSEAACMCRCAQSGCQYSAGSAKSAGVPPVCTNTTGSSRLTRPASISPISPPNALAV